MIVDVNHELEPDTKVPDIIYSMDGKGPTLFSNSADAVNLIAEMSQRFPHAKYVIAEVTWDD